MMSAPSKEGRPSWLKRDQPFHEFRSPEMAECFVQLTLPLYNLAFEVDGCFVAPPWGTGFSQETLTAMCRVFEEDMPYLPAAHNLCVRFNVLVEGHSLHPQELVWLIRLVKNDGEAWKLWQSLFERMPGTAGEKKNEQASASHDGGVTEKREEHLG